MDPSLDSASIGQAVQPELMSGERLLWSGQPSTRVIFHKSDWFAIPFSLMWGGFAIFWEWSATGHFGAATPSGHIDNLFFAAWGIPFIVIGQYVIWGRFLYEAWLKQRTYYALSNKRVIVILNGFSRKVVDGYLSALTATTLSEGANGFGSIEFSPDPTYDTYSSRKRNSNRMGLDLSRLAFYDVPEVRQLYDAVRTQRDRVQNSKPIS